MMGQFLHSIIHMLPRRKETLENISSNHRCQFRFNSQRKSIYRNFDFYHNLAHLDLPEPNSTLNDVSYVADGECIKENFCKLDKNMVYKSITAEAPYADDPASIGFRSSSRSYNFDLDHQSDRLIPGFIYYDIESLEDE